MLSTMMDQPLTIHQIFWRIERMSATKPIATQRADGEPVRTTWR